MKRGALFTAVNGTADTAIAHEVLTAFNADKALFTIQNSGEGKVIRPQLIRLICAVAPASGVSMRAAISVDPTARFSSGGTALTPKCRDGSKSIATIASNVVFGAVALATATATVRYLSRNRLRHAIPVVGDEYVLHFGDNNRQSSSIILNGTTPQQIAVAIPEVTLGFGDCMNLHVWYPSNATTPSQWEVEATWSEDDA